MDNLVPALICVLPLGSLIIMVLIEKTFDYLDKRLELKIQEERNKNV